MRNNILSKFIFVFVSAFIFTVPFSHAYIPDIAGFLHPFFEGLARWTGRNILTIQKVYTTQLVSDSTGLYIHLLNLVIISALAVITWTIVERRKVNYRKLYYWFRVIISYYLALQLFEYGFNKLFKWQFYLPEPNTLFTTIVNTPRDLLYWSSMGLSRPYTVFAGITEILAALLLVFRTTRFAGAVFAFIILTNVGVINFSYDISVKVFSSFLLLLSIIIIAPDSRRLFSFFTGKNPGERMDDAIVVSPGTLKFYTLIKAIVILYILFSTLSVYFIENNFNDDKAVRPRFHGAYDVITFIKNGDTIPPLLTDTSRWKRVFVHRRGYFITQDMSDRMQDYGLLTDTATRRFIIEREADMQQFNLKYIQNPDGTLSMHGIIATDSLDIILKPVDMKNLPALQNEFNWTIDN